MFSIDKFNEWKKRMQAHLAATHEDMMEVIQNGPIQITQVNIDPKTMAEQPQVPKLKSLWTSEEKKKHNLDNVVMDIFFKTLDSKMFTRISDWNLVKEIWDKLAELCEGSDAIKANKLTVAIQKFETFKMKESESIDQIDCRFTVILDKLTILGKTYTQQEICLKILRALPKEWRIKTTTM